MNQELFLTSSVHKVAHHIASRLQPTHSKKLLFIDTAVEPKRSGDTSWLDKDKQALIDAGFHVSNNYTITGKNREEIQNDVEDYHFLYVSGGNVNHLLLESHKSGFSSLVKELVQERGKKYIGTSAGSVVTGSSLPMYYAKKEPQLDSFTGYGLVNFSIAPHWGSDDFHDMYLNERMKEAYKEDQIPLILLNDYQYVHVMGGAMELIDVKKN